MKVYTGIGARKAPKDILILIGRIAKKLAEEGWVLRSGGANGCDSAFERGCDAAKGKKEIYLAEHCEDWCLKMVERFLPSGRPPLKEMKEFTQKLLGRNMKQVFGENGDTPTRFVICWTPEDLGGTGYALRAAKSEGIPVFNLREEETRKKLLSFVEGKNKTSK